MKYIKSFESLALTVGAISGIFLFDKLRMFIKKEKHNRDLIKLIMAMLEKLKAERAGGFEQMLTISDFPDFYRLYNKESDSYFKIYKTENKVIWTIFGKTYTIDIIDFYRKSMIEYIENEINHGDYLQRIK